MKKLLAILSILILLSSCAILKNVTGIEPPPPPYGVPDDRSTFYTDDFSSITYVYYCYGGKYISVTFTHTGIVSLWDRSDFESTGICNK